MYITALSLRRQNVMCLKTEKKKTWGKLSNHLSVFSHRLHWLLSFPPSIWCAAVETPHRKPSGNRSSSAPVSRWCHFQYRGRLKAFEAVSRETATKQAADQAASARDCARLTAGGIRRNMVVARGRDGGATAAAGYAARSMLTNTVTDQYPVSFLPLTAKTSNTLCPSTVVLYRTGMITRSVLVSISSKKQDNLCSGQERERERDRIRHGVPYVVAAVPAKGGEAATAAG